MSVEGISDLIKSIQRCIPTGDEVQTVLSSPASMLIAEIKSNLPPDNTGNLRNSIKEFKPKSKNYKVIGPKYGKGGGNHANLVEYGFTHKSGATIAPRPFMRPAFDNNKEAILNMMEKKLGDLVQKKFDQ
jgi:HK97 gp10 family phage protein